MRLFIKNENLTDQQLKRKEGMLKGWFNFAAKTFVVMLAVVLLTQYVFGLFIVHDNSMNPRISDGDLVMAYKLDKDIEAKEIIAYLPEGASKVTFGRVVACPGDVVEISEEEGHVFVNGAIQSEDGIYFPTYCDAAKIEFPYTVPEGCYFVLGDNRTAANDSRVYGAVSENEFRGVVMAVLRKRGF